MLAGEVETPVFFPVAVCNVWPHERNGVAFSCAHERYWIYMHQPGHQDCTASNLVVSAPLCTATAGSLSDPRMICSGDGNGLAWSRVARYTVIAGCAVGGDLTAQERARRDQARSASGGQRRGSSAAVPGKQDVSEPMAADTIQAALGCRAPGASPLAATAWGPGRRRRQASSSTQLMRRIVLHTRPCSSGGHGCNALTHIFNVRLSRRPLHLPTRPCRTARARAVERNARTCDD
jgi:hypothetical protein